jgi:hypothetical protein
MHMIGRKAILGMAFLLAAPMLHAGWSVGVSVRAPIYPHCHYRPYCYRPYPIYVAPAPVLVQPVRVVEPVPAYVAPVAAPARAPVVATTSNLGTTREEDVERYRRQLQSVEPRDRVEAAMQLGRLRAPGCERLLAATLSNDRNPQVREASAKALGLIGTTEALEAVQRAAQVDEDNGVRTSAAYSADVIRASYNRR